MAASFLVRIYPAVSAINLTPDAVEYLDLARHNARGEFGAVSLKRHYLDDYPVVYTGNGLRPPLFPLAAGAVLALFDSVEAVQVFNALVASLAVGVWYLAFAALFSWNVAAGGALAASCSVWFLGSSVIALTEPLSMLLVGSAVWSVASGRWNTAGGAAGLGALCGLAFLARRMNGMLFPLVMGLFVVAAWRQGPGADRRRMAALCLPFLLASAALLTPFGLKNVRDFGTPFYDPNTAVLRGGAETFDHYSVRPHESIAAYVTAQGVTRVARAVARGFLTNVKAVTAGPGGLGLLSLVLPLTAIHLLRERQPAGVWFLVSLAVTNLTAYSLVGFHGYDDPRFILLTTFPLCALCLHTAETWGAFRGAGRRTTPAARNTLAAEPVPSEEETDRKREPLLRKRRPFPPGFLVAVLVAASVLQGVGILAARIRKIPAVTLHATPVRVLPEVLLRYPPEPYDRLLRELQGHAAGPEEVVATGMPWLVHFFTGGPTALLPVDLTPETFPSYLEQYGVRAVVLDPESLGRERFLRYREWVEAQARAGNGVVWESAPFVFYRPEPPAGVRARPPVTRLDSFRPNPTMDLGLV